MRVPGGGWAVATAAGGTVLIGAGAFWLSFTALADLAVRSGIGAGQAWIWPLLVDGLIVVATVAVVALDGHRTAWYPWGLLIAGALMSVTANAIHALVAADASVPGMLAATVAAVPPLVLLASTHLTVVLTRSTGPSGVPEATIPAVEPRPPVSAITLPSDPEPKAAPPRARPDAPVPEISAVASTGPEPDQRAPGRPERPRAGVSPAADSAASTVEADRGQQSRDGPGGDRRERAAALRERGWSNKRIARELRVHPSTVGRWLPPADPPR